MQKLGISLFFFFTLCLATTASSFASNKAAEGGIPNMDSLLAHMNLDSMMHRVNLDSIMHSVNVDSIMQRVNVDSIMKRVNIDSIMHKVNLDSLMGRMNFDSLCKVAKPKLEEMFQSSMLEPAQNSGTNIAVALDKLRFFASDENPIRLV